MTKPCKFSYKRPSEEACIKAKASNLRVKFTTLLETANAICGLSVNRAEAYLKNVLARKECVPFRRFKSGVGRCAQAKKFKTVSGRWPVKAVKCVQGILKNAVANAEFYGKDPQEMSIRHIQVNAAPVEVRRTFRAHGRINPYERHLSHVQLVLGDVADN